MQQRGFFLLVAATVILVGAATYAAVTGPTEITRPPPGKHAFPGLAAQLGQVHTLGILRHDLQLTFVRKGAGWVVPQKADYPARSGKVAQVVRTLADMTLIAPKTREPRLYSRLDVGPPGHGKATLVWVSGTSGGTLAALIVGKERPDRLGAGVDAVYVRKPGRKQSWLARGSLNFSGGLSSWLEKTIVNIPEKRIAEVILTQPGGGVLHLVRKAPGDPFTVVDAPAGTAFKSASVTAEPGMALAHLDLADVAPAARLPVPGHGLWYAVYRTFDGLTVDLKLFEYAKKNWVRVHAEGAGKVADEAKAIEKRVAPWIYAIPDFDASLLKTKLADLLAPKKP